MNSDRALLVVLGVALLAVGAIVIPATAAAGAPSDGADPVLDLADTDSGVAMQTNNTTVRHRHPDEADEGGDLDEVQAWLAGRMGEQLTESSIHLSEGEYELARTVVDEEYRSQLGKFVDVAGETEDESDDSAGEEFERARDRQDEYAESVEEYQETREEYEEAKRAGDEERARELARELERIAADVNETGGDLTDSLRTVSNGTGVDLADAERNVEEVRTNVSEQQASIREAEFVETELTATAAADRASFTDPLTVTGRLAAENGTALANRTVVLEADERAAAATTDADGQFSLEYRPRIAPVGNATLTARFVPGNASAYLGSADNVTAVIEQVEPTVELENHTERAGYDDPVVAAGTVGVDGIGAAGVPLIVEIDGEQIGTVETREDGTFAFEGSLPATAEPGERPLRVRVPLENRALASANAGAPLTVTTTDTTVTLDVAEVEEQTVEVDGRLTTADGRSIDDRTVTLLVNETTVTTATTGPNGTFDANVTVPSSIVADGESAAVTIRARFDGSGTNLESATAEATVTVTAPGDDAREGLLGLGLPGEAWVALAAALALALGALYRFRDRGDASGDEARPIDPEEPAGPPDPESGQESAPLLELARNRLRGGSADGAVEAGYGAVRRRLEGTIDLASPGTHWEFYRAYREAGLDTDRADALRRLTELYERAAFTPDPVSTEAAEDAVSAADEIASRSGTEPPGDD